MVVNNLYRTDSACAASFRNAADESSFSFDDSVLKESLKRIYSNDFDPMTDIEENLFNEFWTKLNQATEEGYRASAASLPIGEGRGGVFLEELRYNNGVFAAFKTHRAQNDMAAQLLNKEGQLKPFEQWVNDVQPIADHQCRQWFRTEYDMAVTRAHQAADWQQFEAEKDVLPNLEWLKSTSITPGEDHRIFWGVIRPVDSPAWNEHRPGDRWGCKCRLRATDKPATASNSVNPVNSVPDEGLRGNPGTTGAIFDQSHPYFQNALGDNAQIMLESDRLITKYSRTEVRKFFKAELQGDPKSYPVKDGVFDSLTIAYQDIKNITGKPHKYNYLKNTSCYYLPETFKEMDYLGSSPDIKDATVPGHGDAENWHYYRFTLNKEDSFLVVKENKKGEKRLHSIQDKEHFKPGKIKNPWRKR